MKYCTEIEFKNSSYGKNIIAKIKKNYGTPDRPILDNYFMTSFLNAYAKEYGKVFNCYQDALEFWSNQRYNAMASEAQLSQGNIVYQEWLKQNKNPFDSIIDIFKYAPMLIGALIVYQLVKK